MAPRTLPEFITLNSHAFARGKVSSKQRPGFHASVLRHDVLEAAIDTFVQVGKLYDNLASHDDILKQLEKSVFLESADAWLIAVPGCRSAKELADAFKADKQLEAWHYGPDCKSTAFQCEGFKIRFMITSCCSGASRPAMTSLTAVPPLVNYSPFPVNHGSNTVDDLQDPELEDFAHSLPFALPDE